MKYLITCSFYVHLDDVGSKSKSPIVRQAILESPSEKIDFIQACYGAIKERYPQYKDNFLYEFLITNIIKL